MTNYPVEESNELALEELISQHMLLFSPVDESDSSFSLVQPHPFLYVPNVTTDAALVENPVIETTQCQTGMK